MSIKTLIIDEVLPRYQKALLQSSTEEQERQLSYRLIDNVLKALSLQKSSKYDQLNQHHTLPE